MGYHYKKVKRIKDRHRQVVHYYFTNGFKKVQAVRDAGYAFPENNSDKIFNHPLVIQEMEKRREKMYKEMELTKDWIVSRLMRLADSNISLAKFKRVDAAGALYWDFTDATEEELAVITELQTDAMIDSRGKVHKKFKIGVVDPKSALDSLAKIQGLFTDKVEVTAGQSLIEQLQAGRARVAQGEEDGVSGPDASEGTE